MLISYAMAVSLAAAGSAGGTVPLALTDRHRVNDGPYLEVWTNHDDAIGRGERVRVYFRVDRSSYVTIFRVDTDGRVRVLFPRDPWDDSYARGDQRYEVYGYGERQAFVVDDYPGQGYVFGVASLDPFSYSDFVRGDHWDYQVIAAGGRIAGDPYVALMDLIDHIVPRNYVDYTYDVVPYYVEQKYDYPRFLCYDCHAYAAFPYWDPYAHSCFRFRMVIYDDPFYYPARFYPGTRVVYPRGVRLEPRYVFKDRDQIQPYVTRVRERPQDPATGRRVIDPGITARDLGGTGRIPAPIARPRSTEQGGPGGVTDPRRTPEDRRANGSDRDEPRRIDVPRDRRPATAVDGGQPETPKERARTDGQDPVVRPRPQLERREPKREIEQPTGEPKEEPRREQPPPPRQEEPRRPERRPEASGEGIGGRPITPRAEPQPERRPDPPPKVVPRQPAPANPPQPRPADPPQDGVAGRRIERPQLQ